VTDPTPTTETLPDGSVKITSITITSPGSGYCPIPMTQTLPDGAIRVCLGRICGIVSSWHLVPGKVQQLRRLLSTPTPDTP
jgi:hypothetical protein